MKISTQRDLAYMQAVSLNGHVLLRFSSPLNACLLAYRITSCQGQLATETFIYKYSIYVWGDMHVTMIIDILSSQCIFFGNMHAWMKSLKVLYDNMHVRHHFKRIAVSCFLNKQQFIFARKALSSTKVHGLSEFYD